MTYRPEVKVGRRSKDPEPLFPARHAVLSLLFFPFAPPPPPSLPRALLLDERRRGLILHLSLR
ncbi:hypothetical protein U9M48_020793 [Paspalum notatum var. saurae]|uniref:Uncharacterized protein n=1 Tax=Paspalum notatum var. saurae TaxID=547442 RepID=A0AAQ3WT01_PASNO